ncbi:hypothetical protein VULLAG_LOCUS22456 [Vulpes lagopus]
MKRPRRIMEGGTGWKPAIGFLRLPRKQKQLGIIRQHVCAGVQQNLVDRSRWQVALARGSQFADPYGTTLIPPGAATVPVDAVSQDDCRADGGGSCVFELLTSRDRRVLVVTHLEMGLQTELGRSHSYLHGCLVFPGSRGK